MGQSTILLINELAPNQTNAFQTVNDAVAALEEASNSTKYVDMSGGDVMVPIQDLTRYQIFEVQDPVGDVMLTFPGYVEPLLPIGTKRVLGVVNNNPYTVTIANNTSLNTIILPPYSSKIIKIDFEEMATLGAVIAHSLGAYSFGSPGSDDTLVRYSFVESVTYVAGQPASLVAVASPPASEYTLELLINDVVFGTITIDTDGSYIIDNSETTFVFGDVLAIRAPNVVDPAIAGISITLVGRRV